MNSRADASRTLLNRRALLAGMAAAPLLSARAWAAGGATPLRPLLDRAAAASPAAATEMLRSISAANLDPTDRAILSMVVRGMEREQALRRAWPDGKPDGSSPYAISHRHGAWQELGGKSSPAAVARALQEETARLGAAAAAGRIPPRLVLERLLAAERPLLDRTPAEARGALAAQIETVETLLARAPSGPGIWVLPGGGDYYALRLRAASGSALTPQALDRIVGTASRVLLARADRLFHRIGLAQGSVGARFRALKQRPADLYTNDGSGRDRAVADMNAALARLRPHLPAWFDPPLELGSRVARLSPAEEAQGKRGYRDAPADGRPGTYFPDLSSPADRPRWTLVTVAHHETIPGHMLQLRRQAIAAPATLQVRYAAGYSEGWAIYAESLVDRMGLLSTVEQLGFIQSVLFRLARVSADIGLHLHRWDRARAIRYLQETVGFELFFPFDVEVDRYCAEPAAFAGDALVAITLMRLAARRRPGAAMRAFHDAVLNRGPLNAEALHAVGG